MQKLKKTGIFSHSSPYQLRKQRKEMQKKYFPAFFLTTPSLLTSPSSYQEKKRTISTSTKYI